MKATNGLYSDISITNSEGVQDGGLVLKSLKSTRRNANGEETLTSRMRTVAKGTYQIAWTFAHDESLQTVTDLFTVDIE